MAWVSPDSITRAVSETGALHVEETTARAVAAALGARTTVAPPGAGCSGWPMTTPPASRVTVGAPATEQLTVPTFVTVRIRNCWPLAPDDGGLASLSADAEHAGVPEPGGPAGLVVPPDGLGAGAYTGGVDAEVDEAVLAVGGVVVLLAVDVVAPEALGAGAGAGEEQAASSTAPAATAGQISVRIS